LNFRAKFIVSMERAMSNRGIITAILVAALLSLSACANTIRGVGKDVKQTGRAVSQAVR
jgi:predicted small secreted protein